MAKEALRVGHRTFANGPVVDLRQLYLEINAFETSAASSSGVDRDTMAARERMDKGTARRTTSAKNS